MSWYKDSKLVKYAQMKNGVIELTPNEKKIFDFLNSVNQKYNLNTTMRVAGGWVRDKCLGKESHDIDIALDNMTGKQFVKYIEKETGSPAHVISSNPDKSKHLETATITLFGQQIDFVNLRDESFGETYKDGKR